ncbi:MAG: Ig domain-containing protein [Acidobacteriota bacterium]
MIAAGVSIQASEWRLGPAAPPPMAARYAHAMVYDSARHVVVLVGGVNADSDTWEYDGVAWTGRGIGSPYCEYCGMAYDTSRARVVMAQGCCWDNKTFVYDGVSWRWVATGPYLPRAGQGMSYDAMRDRVVMVGGLAETQEDNFAETWEWDGSTWTLQQPCPVALAFFAMDYDSTRGVVVMNGGLDYTLQAFDETLEYLPNGTWRSGPSGPSPRGLHAMAFDKGSSAMVLFGGEAASLFGDTWEYDGSGWTRITSFTGPSARARHAMAYDDARDKVVLFGGDVGGVALRDTWEYGDCLTVSPPTLPGGTISVPYAATLTATGGVGPYTFAVIAGALPPGLTLSPGGLISGFPVSVGTFSFTVEASSSGGCSGRRILAIDVAASCAISPPALPGGQVGTAYAATLVATGGVGPYVFSLASGSLPPFVSLGSDGTLQGVLFGSGTYAFSVRASDGQACDIVRPYTIEVAARESLLSGEGTGQPNENRVRLHTASGGPTPVDFQAYAASHFGVNVAAGNVNGGAAEEILTAPGPGPSLGPQVRAFAQDGTPIAKVSYYAYATLKHGAEIERGDLDADAFDEILTGAGPSPSFGPHVRGWNYDGVSVSAIAKVSYFAYSTVGYGVVLAGGTLDADPYAEIVTAPGPGPTFAPQVRGWNYDGAAVNGIAGINFSAFGTPSCGARVATGDVTADSLDDIVASPGPGPTLPARFAAFRYLGAIGAIPGFDTTPFTTAYGGRPATGFPTKDASADLVCGAGPDPAAPAILRVFDFELSTLTPVVAFAPFPASFGVSVGSGSFGY